MHGIRLADGSRLSAVAAQMTIDAAMSLGNIDLTPYALGQGGLSSQVMFDDHIPELAALQPRTIRLFLQEYLDMYPASGVYNWTKLDALMSAVVATGARPIANIDFKPAVLYPTIDQTIVDPTSYPEWEELIYQLVMLCKAMGFGVQSWEIDTVSISTGSDAAHMYAFNAGDFAAAGTNNHILEWFAGSGVYGPIGSARPDSTFNGNDYLRHVIFEAD